MRKDVISLQRFLYGVIHDELGDSNNIAFPHVTKLLNGL